MKMSDKFNTARFLLACCANLFLFASGVQAQSWGWPLVRMEGDSIWQSFPPADSSYIHNELILKFRRGVLKTDSICYDCSRLVETRAKAKGEQTLDDPNYWWLCKQIIMLQRFSINIIDDPTLRSVLSSHGVTTLRRMTAANPCTDTVSVARGGDSLHINDFDWMIAEFNNDTSVLPTLINLYLSYDASLEVAEPNYYLPLLSGPCDPEYAAVPTRQSSLNMIGMPSVWPFTVGDAAIKVGVVDIGVDYWRCDLGGAFGAGNKVIDGWDYSGYQDFCTSAIMPVSAPGIFHTSEHGTAIASILGGLTDNAGCAGVDVAKPHGMVGIAGGWGTVCSDPSRGIGVSIVGFNCVGQPGDPAPTLANVASATLEAAAKSTGGPYGYGVNLINLSLGGPAFLTASTLHNATTAAYLEGVSVIAAKGNNTGSTPVGPADYEPSSEIITVGASDHTMARIDYSNWNNHLDLLAPGGKGGADWTGGGPDPELDHIVRRLSDDGTDCTAGASTNADVFKWWSGTSMSAPHVTGVAALLWSYLPTISMPFIVEDIEGMLKASAWDNGPTNGQIHDPYITPAASYLDGYDVYTGWGFMKADKLFTMLDPAGDYAYSLKHVEAATVDIDMSASFTDFGKITILSPVKTGPHGGPPPSPTSTVYTAKIREIKGHASYAGLGINTGQFVYVWGNGSGNRGIANTNWNFSEPWCEVTDANSSGYGGGNGIVVGIEHKSSTTVNLHTFQFDLTDLSGTHVGHFPKDADLGLGFTVFGATKATSGVAQSEQGVNGMRLWPSIASDHVTLESGRAFVKLIITDVLGRTVYELNFHAVTESVTIPTIHLVSGSYIARTLTDSAWQQCSFIIKH